MWQTLSALLGATELWSAIVGALIGGAIAAGVEYRALRSERAERELTKKETERALARSLLLKLMRIHSNILNIGKYIAHALAKGRQIDASVDPWAIVQPSAFQPNPVTFSAEEMGMLHSLGNDELFNRVISLDESHNLIVGLVPSYNQRRTLLTDQLTVEIADDGRTAITAVDDNWRKLRSIMLDLNSIINQAEIQSRTQVSEAAWALVDFAKLARERFGLKIELSGIAFAIPEFGLPSPAPKKKSETVPNGADQG